MQSQKGKYLFITLFTLAMAFLETTVVVYLREIYYPEGFKFPFKLMDYQIGQVEFLREFATLVMIFTSAWLVGQNRTEKFAIFLIIFGVWDIFYYIYLYLILAWPPALATWDILFLIPVTWVGPVWAPMLNALTMILLAVVLVYKRNLHQRSVMKRKDWMYLIIGSLFVIIAFTEDYINYLLNYMSPAELFAQYYNQETLQLTMAYIPNSFALWVFLFGVTIHVGVVLRILTRKHFTERSAINSLSE